MDAQRARFVDGAVDSDIPKAKADEIFDLLAKFADYGFNKSHAAAYALISYQTAYLKANYPVEFLAASMTLDKANTDKLAEFRNEAQRLGITVEPPSVNLSGVDFEVDAEQARHPLRAVGRQGRRRRPGRARSCGRGAAGLSRRSATSRPASTRARSTRRCWKASLRPARFDELEADRAGCSAASSRCWAWPTACTASGRRARARCSADGDETPVLRPRPQQAWPAAAAAAARVRRDRLLPVGPSARRLRPRARAACGSSAGRISPAP